MITTQVYWSLVKRSRETVFWEFNYIWAHHSLANEVRYKKQDEENNNFEVKLLKTPLGRGLKRYWHFETSIFIVFR